MLGGAISTNTANTSVTLTECLFTNNGNLLKPGGAIYMLTGTLVSIRSNFSQNSASKLFLPLHIFSICFSLLNASPRRRSIPRFASYLPRFCVNLPSKQRRVSTILFLITTSLLRFCLVTEQQS